MRNHSRAFTLLEILLVVAAIGILAAIVIVAINPQRQLGKVRDAERQSEINSIQDGIKQYALDNEGKYPSGLDVNEYKEVCDTEAVDPSSCPDTYVDLSDLVPKQLAAIPRGPLASDTNAKTGYEASRDGNGNVTVKAPNTEVDSSAKRAGGSMSVSYSLGSASYDNNKRVIGQSRTPRGAAFNGNGTKMFVINEDDDNVYSYNLSTGYDLSTASYNQTFDVSGQTYSPEGIAFNGSGTKMFVVGFGNTHVYSYNVSTAYDISTASYNQKLDVSGQDEYPQGVRFNGDGSKMFVVGFKNDNVYSYNLSTAYDLASASYNRSFDVSGQEGSATGMKFNGDGSKMFVVGYSGDNVYSYNLSTAYDLSSATYNRSFDVSVQDGVPRGVTFNGDGSKMFVVGDDNNNVYSYNVSTAYDLSSASYNQSFDTSGQDGSPLGTAFNGDGTKMFVAGADDDNVYSYNLSTAYDLGSASYNQSFDVSGQETQPTGVTFNGDGTKMFLVGYDYDNVYSYDLSTAYDISSASYNKSFDVSVQDGTATGVTFNGDGTKMYVVGNGEDQVFSYDLSTAYDLGSASYNQKFDVSGPDNQPRSVTFNDDGTKMFVAGLSNGIIYSYDVSTAYDISSASYNQKFDVSGEENYPVGVEFNGDGTKMFMAGLDTETIHRYSSTEEQ